MAKQLQEEDLKAQAQLQKRYKALEQHDCEIAQEIQEKLTIEAERRRIQEKKDEDIARLLQEKELQEEKKRKKRTPEFSGGSASGDNYYYEDGDQSRSRRDRELGSGHSKSGRLQNDGKTVKQEEKWRHRQENSEELDEQHPSERPLPSVSWGRGRDDVHTACEQQERKQCGRERPWKSRLPKISGEVFLSTDSEDWGASGSPGTPNREKQSRHHGGLSPKSSQKAGLPCKEIVYGRDLGQGNHRERRHRPRTSPFSEDKELRHHHVAGMKSRGMNEAVPAPARGSHRDQEWYDAEIARKLQEEELLATHMDIRAAQVAQDEEIARLLMAEEKKAYKKAKDREKSSLDKRKHDYDCKSKAKSAHSKSKEGDETQRAKIDRPSRPPPPAVMDPEDVDPTHFTNQHSNTRHFSKSESSHKGFHNKQ